LDRYWANLSEVCNTPKNSIVNSEIKEGFKDLVEESKTPPSYKFRPFEKPRNEIVKDLHTDSEKEQFESKNTSVHKKSIARENK
jgi:hypothetical protein